MMAALIARGYPPAVAAGLLQALYAAERADWRAIWGLAEVEHALAPPGPLAIAELPE
jgi:hypothetical protein